MKITVDSKSLVEAMQWATKNFDGRDDKAFVALKIDSRGEGSMSHANSTSFLKSPFTVLDRDLPEDEDFVLALQGQFVQRLAGSLDSTGPSELRYEGDSLKLKNKLGNFTIPTFKAKVPSEPTIEVIGDIDNVVYFDALQRLAKLCDPSSAGLYPVLGTVDLSFNFEDSKAVLMATDRYTLGEIVVDFTPAPDAADVLSNKTNDDGKVNLLLPYTSAVLVSPVKGAVSTTELVYEASSGKFGYAFADGKIAIFSLQEAEPLAYATLKSSAESSTVNSVQVSTKDLQKALATISTLAWDENDIYMALSEDGLIVTDTSQANKLQVEVLGGTVETDDTVKFIRSVINKAFAPIATANVNLKWESVTSAFVFEPVLDDGTVAENVFVLAIPSA